MAERENGYLFTPEQQKVLDELGKRKNEMDFEEWKNTIVDKMFQYILPKLGHHSGKNPDESIEEAITENQRFNGPLADAITNFWRKIGAFNPDEGSLSHYAQRAIKRMYYANRAMEERGMFTPPPDGDKEKDEEKKKRTRPVVVSTDQLDENGKTGEREIPDDFFGKSRVDDKLALSQTLTAMILRFASQVRGNKLDEQFRWYQMWYSERSVLGLELGWPVYNERDTAAVMDYGYLSFFMKEDFTRQELRNVESIRRSSPEEQVKCKCVGKSVQVRWNDKGWLPAAIPREYAATWKTWETVYPTDSTITTSRKKFQEEYLVLMER